MHWMNWVMLVVIVLMPILMFAMTQKVTAQRRRQNELLERIAKALENRP